MVYFLRVNNPAVSQGYTYLRFEHGQLKKLGDAVNTVVTKGAQRKVRAGVTIDEASFYELGDYFRGNIAIANARAVRHNYVHEGFGIADSDAANLGDSGINVMFGKFGFNGFNDRQGTGCPATCGCSNNNLGFITVFQSFPLC